MENEPTILWDGGPRPQNKLFLHETASQRCPFSVYVMTQYFEGVYPLQSARTILNHFHPGSFPDPLHLPTEPAEKLGEYFDAVEAAIYLRLSERQLRDLCRDQNITHARIDYRTYRFRKSDLDEWFEAYKIKRKSVYN